ncbi:GD25790 [Drosophila simulans]|uniref:GD25790 n=1 Tax=Drosophila simulans TaxID=7240 RepID=B4QDY2_DROSI|nr:GD25790 [Drosophila simulans]
MISDDEIAADKLDFGPSLLDEINSMFGSISAATGSHPKSPGFDHVNSKNEITEMSAKLGQKSGDTNGNKHGHGLLPTLSKKKSSGTVKPISVKDEKILNHAIEIANEISARSMIDLVSDQTPVIHSPKRKFSFRFPHLSNNGSGDKAGGLGASGSAHTPTHGNASPFSKKKNFTEELQSIPDIQSLIGKEGLEAYNSLIERKALLDIGPSPAATLLRHLDTDEFDLQSLHQSQRPMTLPTRGATQRVRKAELAAGLSRHNDENSNSLEACESPSYMTHGSYKFPEAHPTEQLPEPESPNPIPLPPREGKKQVKTSTKRHVRKYPLIIPANGLQRTLSKLTDFGDEAGKSPEISTSSQPQPGRAIEVVAAVRPSGMRRPSLPSEREYENMPTVGKESAHTYQNLDKLTPADAAGLTDTASLQFESILEADTSKEGILQSPDVTDGFYNFSIQKEHYNKGKDAEFEATQISGLYVNDDELRNLDIESSRRTATPGSSCSALESEHSQPDALPSTETASEVSRFSSVDNELAGNALFKKVRASVNMAMNRKSIAETSLTSNQTGGASVKPQTEAEYFAATAARLADSNSVSCEDLLEFSDKKPKGCERGVDSDEVRIMVKVLGKDSTPNRCLGALEFINWDVHKSIKLIKLQNLVSEANLSLEASFEALQQHEWDLHTTAHKLNGLKL